MPAPRFGSNSTKLVRCWSNLADVCRVFPNIGQIRPTLANIGDLFVPIWANIGHPLAKFDQRWPNSVRCWPTPRPQQCAKCGQLGPNLAAFWPHLADGPSFGQFVAKLGHIWSTSGRISASGAFFRQLLRNIWAMCGQLWGSPGSPGVTSQGVRRSVVPQLSGNFIIVNIIRLYRAAEISSGADRRRF